jgi:Carboxypeptidase regulatory-like domain
MKLIMRNFAIVALVIGVIALLVAVQPALADNLYGSIRGTVTDPSGAALSSITVVAMNTDTGVETRVTSNQTGGFVFPQLAIGNYKVTVSASNFKTYQQSGIHLNLDQVYAMNVKLELGAVSESIQVEANPVQVDSTSIQLTADIDAKKVVDLPLIGRNWVTLQQTLPGVVTPDTRFSTNYSTNGSQAQQNSYLMNGNDFNDLPLNSPLATPNPDTIAEVKMVTNTLNPEFGRNSGAILNAVTKSGTNALHGTGFWFYRDSFLQTHSYFQLTPPPIHQNRYGGTIGGPIWKRKMFFFYGLEINRARTPDTNFQNLSFPTVFTQAQLNGTWDAAALSTKVIPKNLSITGPGGPCAAGTTWASCFVGGVVPTSNYNPLATQLVQKFVPLPNNGTEYSFNPITQDKQNQHTGRFDWTISSKDTLWFYAFANDRATTNTIPFTGADLPGFGDGSVPYTKQFTSSWTHTFTGNILNEFRLGYTRFNFPSGQPTKVVQPAQVGFPTIFPQLASASSYPTMTVNNYFTLGGTTNGPQPRKDQTYQVTDNFSWIKGAHAFKFGYDGRKFQVWNPFLARLDGSFTFDPTATYSTGDAGLDFLLGIPAAFNQSSGSLIIADGYEHYLYFQDQWKVKNNLTLTYGTGFQVDTPISEYQNHGITKFCFQPGVQSTVFPGAPAGYTVSGDSGCTKSGFERTKYHFGPRFGFAYSPDMNNKLTGGPGKMSIRGGIGWYFNRSEEELNLQDLGIPPFGQNSNGATDAGLNPSFPDPWTDINGGGVVPNKFPYNPPGPGANIDFSVFQPMGPGLNTNPKNFTTPYSTNYNLTVERQLPGEMILRVGYVGATGKKLFTSYTFNPTTPAGVQACLADPNNFSNGGATGGCADFPLSQPVNFPSHYKYDGSIWTNAGQQTNGGWSHYNSLQVTVDKHFSHGLDFLSAYTWSHSLDVSSSFEDTAFQLSGGVNQYGNFRGDYGSSAFDARHRWVISGGYEIPSLHKVWAGAPDRVFGGWRLTGINTLQSGFPINFQSTNVPSLTCSWQLSFYGCGDRPQTVFRPHAVDPRSATFTSPLGGNVRTHYWFDPTAMTDAPLGQYGNVPRGYFVGPGYTNLDFSIQKDTTITEGKILQLRLEAYNAFNHTNFANPSGNVDSTNFGRITATRSFTNSRLVQLGAKFTF